jgi:hypothetical protein
MSVFNPMALSLDSHPLAIDNGIDGMVNDTIPDRICFHHFCLIVLPNCDNFLSRPMFDQAPEILYWIQIRRLNWKL